MEHRRSFWVLGLVATSIFPLSMQDGFQFLQCVYNFIYFYVIDVANRNKECSLINKRKKERMKERRGKTKKNKKTK